MSYPEKNEESCVHVVYTAKAYESYVKSVFIRQINENNVISTK